MTRDTAPPGSAARSLPALAPLILALTAPWLAGSVGAQDLLIDSPPAQPTFGPVEFSVSSSQTIRNAVFYLDGRPVGRRQEAPWSVQVDVGQENRERVFRVVADFDSGTVEATRQTPAIRIDEEVTFQLQQVYVTVANGHRRVLGMEQDRFELFDNGRRQELVTFEGGDVPLEATLLVDASASMKGRPLEAALRGVETFTSSLNDLDEVSVALFSDGVRYQTPWSNWADDEQNEASGSRARLAAVEARGNTAVFDMLYTALTQLEARQGRRVVLLLSDGSDVVSGLDMENVRWKAQRTSTMIYWLRLDADSKNRSYSTIWRDAEKNDRHRRLLEKTVQESGGRIIELTSLEEVPGAFSAVIHELREQYVLGYYPSNLRSDGAWHDIKVKVAGNGATARARAGYIDH